MINSYRKWNNRNTLDIQFWSSSHFEKELIDQYFSKDLLVMSSFFRTQLYCWTFLIKGGKSWSSHFCNKICEKSSLMLFWFCSNGADILILILLHRQRCELKPPISILSFVECFSLFVSLQSSSLNKAKYKSVGLAFVLKKILLLLYWN
jgi:hypothetical protein